MSVHQVLIDAAIAAARNAYAPYSQFRVGAALLTVKQEIFTGCNVENASYTLTTCAERVAVGTAVTAGHREWTRMAIASAGGVPPCGACRQVLAEFAPDLPLLLVDLSRVNELRECTLSELFPQPFGLS